MIRRVEFFFIFIQQIYRRLCARIYKNQAWQDLQIVMWRVPVVSTPRYVILCGLETVSWYFTILPPVPPPPCRFKCNYLYVKVSYSEHKTNTSFHRKKSDPKVITHVDSKNIFTPNKLYTTEHKIPLQKLFELLFKRYYPPSVCLFPSLPTISLCLTVHRNISSG